MYIDYELSLIDALEYIKNEYTNLPMGPLEKLLVCTIKHNLIKKTLNISQSNLIRKIIQGFNNVVKSLMTFNIPATPNNIYRRDTVVA